MQYSSRGECLSSNSVCKGCSQKVKKLLKFESSVSSILSMLKASIQALALTATTQVPSAKRASISSHFHLPSNRLALEDSSLTPWGKALCQPRRHRAMKHFSNSKFNVAACIVYITVFTTLQNYHANLHFHFHSANLVRHWNYLLDNLIGSGKCLAEFEVCRLYLPDRFPAYYTRCDIRARWGLGTRLQETQQRLWLFVALRLYLQFQPSYILTSPSSVIPLEHSLSLPIGVVSKIKRNFFKSNDCFDVEQKLCFNFFKIFTGHHFFCACSPLDELHSLSRFFSSTSKEQCAHHWKQEDCYPCSSQFLRHS